MSSTFHRPLIRERDTPAASAIILGLAMLIAALVLTPMTPPAANIAYAGDNIWTWAGVSGTVMQIVTDPLNPSIVYSRVGASFQSTDRIMKSTDGGDIWSNIASAGWTQVSCIAMAASAPNVLYAATSAGVYRTNDGGSTWDRVHADTRAQAIAVSPVDWRAAYLATSIISGATATTVMSKTIDGGQTWSDSGSGLPAYPPIDSIAIAPSAPHILIAKPFNMANGPLYKSTNGGQSWSPVGDSSLVATNAVTFDPKNSNIIYLGTFSPGGWKSSDGGANWQPLANGLQQNGAGFVVDPDNTQVVHAANLTAGVLESQDGGVSWAPLNAGIQGLEVRSIAIASRQPLVIYAGLSNAGIWKLTRTAIQDFSITINNAALFTNVTTVTLALTAPPGTAEMQISNDGGFGGAAWESFAPTRQWTITAVGSYVIPRIVYAKFKTNGQISGVYQDDIVLDITPPSGSVTLRDPANRAALARPIDQARDRVPSAAMHAVYLPLVTTPRQVELLLSARDDVSGVGEMMISNRADFADGQWEIFTTSKIWVVPGGPHTIYVMFRDRAGNHSAVYTATTTP